MKDNYSFCNCINNKKQKDKTIKTLDKYNEKFIICVCKFCGLVRQKFMMSPDEAKKYYLSGEYRNDDGTNTKFPNIE